MNVNMYENPILQENIEKLKRLGYLFIEPDAGLLACGDTGKGRMAEPPVIVDFVTGLLEIINSDTGADCIGGVDAYNTDTDVISEGAKDFQPDKKIADFAGKKILVIGGSSTSIVSAIKVLEEEIFGINDSTVRLVNRVVYPTQSVSVVQDDYQVNKITLFDKDIRDYSLAYDKKCNETLFAANKLQTLLYEKTGYWLPVVDKESADKAIFINLVEKTDGDGLYATFEDGRITFDVEYTTSIKKEINDFFEDALSKSSGTLAFDADDSFTRNVRDVFYKDFGTLRVRHAVKSD